jgi:hypothetical protein
MIRLNPPGKNFFLLSLPDTFELLTLTSLARKIGFLRALELDFHHLNATRQGIIKAREIVFVKVPISNKPKKGICLSQALRTVFVRSLTFLRF